MKTTTAAETTESGAKEAAGQQQERKEHVQAQLNPENKKGMKVIVAIDNSDVSMYALRWTLDNIFKHPVDATPESIQEELGMIVIVNVQMPFQPYIYPAGPVIYATPVMVESVRKAQEQNASQIVSSAMNMCREGSIKAETLILEGDPKDMICRAAEEMHADLLVVGSRGLGRVKRAFLGSVSDYCAHHVKCPILIVKPPHEYHK